MVLNRISENTGASAAPKNAVLRWARERLAAEPRVEPDAGDDRPDVEQILAEQPEPEDEEQAGDRRAGHLRLRAVIDEARAQRQKAGVDARRADAADAEVVGEQRVAGRDDGDETAQHVVRTVDDEAEHDERGGIRAHDPQDHAVRHRDYRGFARIT